MTSLPIDAVRAIKMISVCRDLRQVEASFRLRKSYLSVRSISCWEQDSIDVQVPEGFDEVLFRLYKSLKHFVQHGNESLTVYAFGQRCRGLSEIEIAEWPGSHLENAGISLPWL